MRETQFVRQNQAKWQAFEQLLDRPTPDPQAVSDGFVQITDDLAYARTFYPNRSVRVYLNDLARRAYETIHRTRARRGERLRYFWTHELPLLVHESRHAFRLSAFVFGLAVAIGILSSAAVPEFLESILGAGYVEMTRENIESGDPMAVYKQRGELDMALGITFNNILVALRTFVLGIFFMIGSLFILLYNGIMLGSFEYFFYENGLLQESLLTVFMHGALEISAIVIAGAAGLTLGRGLVFPGTHSRLRAFQRSARRGIKIMAGTVPLFVVAGLVEGFLTRHTEIPDAIRAFFILACLVAVLGYFVWLPVHRARRQGLRAPVPARLQPDRAIHIDPRAVKTTGRLFVECFYLFRRHAGRIFGLSAAVATMLCALFFLGADESPARALFIDFSGLGGTLRALADLLVCFDPLYAGLGSWLLFGGLLYLLVRTLAPTVLPEYLPFDRRTTVRLLLHTLTAAALIYGLLWFDHPLLLLGFWPVVGLPLVGLWSGLQSAATGGAAWPRALALLTKQYLAWLALAFSLMLLSLGAFLLLDTGLVYSLLEAILANFAFEASTMRQLSALLLTWCMALVFFLLAALWTCGAAVHYLSAREVATAAGLRAAIDAIGTQSRIKGLLRE